MEIEELRTTWDELGRRDPLWAILTKASARGNRWNRDEFFKTGEYEIKSVLDYVDRMNFKCARERALDFGCGVGRLTQALCEYFRECWGVDIARSMIHLAEQYNQYADRCNYRINESDDLKLFEDNWFDCIYTNLVLQHIHPRFTRKYIGEFLRTLKPAGAAIFAVPSDPIVLEGMQDSAYRAKITIPETTKIMEAGSRKVLAVKVRNVSDSTWLSWADSHGKSNIHLGNHWLSPARKLLTHHDGRAALPRSLYPQMEVELQLTVKAPDEPGDYVMVLDMVLEGVTWFYDKGSEMTELQVHVTEGAAPASVTKPEPAMEMHSIPKSEVLELIRANGGRVLDVQPDYNAPGWMGYRYCVTK